MRAYFSIVTQYFFNVAALAPTWLKGALYQRFLSRLFRNSSSQGLTWTTNLGISSKYRVCFSSPIKNLLCFGKPQGYVAERGTLELSRLLSKFCNAFIDVGAHDGYYIFYLRATLTTPIYYFEPNPVLYKQLTENIKRNGLKNVDGCSSAIASRNGPITFFIDKTDSSCSSLNDSYQNHELEKIDVHAITFDSFIKEKGLTNLCVKVDVENGEFEFLKGALASMHQISFLLIEVLLPAVTDGFIKRMLTELKLQAYYICDYELKHSKDGEFSYIEPQVNWLFCRKSPHELRALLKSSPFSVRD